MQLDYLSLLRGHFRRDVVDTLLAHPTVTCRELARTTCLPEPEIASIVADLESGGWIKPAGYLPVIGAEETPAYRLASDVAYSLGVDLGGTKVAAAIADFTGHITAELTEPTDVRGERYVATQLVELASRLAVRASIDVTKIKTVVIGVPGAVDPSTGEISLAPNIRGLADFDVLRFLRNHFGPRV